MIAWRTSPRSASAASCTPPGPARTVSVAGLQMKRWARSEIVRNNLGNGPSSSSRSALSQSTPSCAQDVPAVVNMRVRSEKKTTRVPCSRAYRSAQPRIWKASRLSLSRGIIPGAIATAASAMPPLPRHCSPCTSQWAGWSSSSSARVSSRRGSAFIAVTFCPSCAPWCTSLPTSSGCLPFRLRLCGPFGDCGCGLHLGFGRLEDGVAVTHGPGRPRLAFVFVVGVLAGDPHCLALVQPFPDRAAFAGQARDPRGCLVGAGAGGEVKLLSFLIGYHRLFGPEWLGNLFGVAAAEFGVGRHGQVPGLLGRVLPFPPSFHCLL